MPADLDRAGVNHGSRFDPGAPVVFSAGNSPEVLRRLCEEYGVHAHLLGWLLPYCWKPGGGLSCSQTVNGFRLSASVLRTEDGSVLLCPPEPRAIMVHRITTEGGGPNRAS